MQKDIIKDITQMLTDGDYLDGADNRQDKLQSTIRLIINQDKEDNWRGGVPKDVLINQYEYDLEALENAKVLLVEKNLWHDNVFESIKLLLDTNESNKNHNEFSVNEVYNDQT